MERGIVKMLGNDATTFAACFYNEKKVAKGEAKLLEMRNFGDLQKYGIHTPVVTSRYLRKIADQNPDVKHPQKHIMFSLPGNPTEEEKQQLVEHAIKVLERLGYKNQPSLIYSHNDTGHWHLHCVTVTVNQTTGEWIDNYMDGRKARHYLDELRGINAPNTIENFLRYKFQTKEQFLSLLRANGYSKSFFDDELEVVNVVRNGDVQHIFTFQEISEAIERNKKYLEESKDRIKQLHSMILDRRQRSMKYLVEDPDVKMTKDGKRHTVTERLRDVRGAAFEGGKAFEKEYKNLTGQEVKGIRKAQFKQFLEELKEQLGISIIFNQWKDGSTRGYTLIDHQTKSVFKGSDILQLDKLLNPDWKKGTEKDLVLSADEANEATHKLVNSTTLTEDIYDALANMGIEVARLSESEIENIAIEYQEEEENRRMAVSLLTELRKEYTQEISEYGEEYKQLCEKGQDAYNHALVAEYLHQLELNNEQDEDEMKLRDRKDFDSLNIGEYIEDVLERYKIYDIAGHYELSKENVDEKTAVDRAYASLQLSLQANEKGEIAEARQKAEEAVAYARHAYDLHENPKLLQREDELDDGSKMQSNEQYDFFLPFVDVKPHIYQYKGEAYISAMIDGEQYDGRKMSKEHFYHYNYSEEQQNVGMALAWHYFSDEIQERQLYNWKQEHFKVGKMPDGVELESAKDYYDNTSQSFYCAANFVFSNGDKLYRNSPYTKEEYHELKKNNYTPEQMACRKYGPEIVGDLEVTDSLSINSIKGRLFGEMADPNSFKGIEETVAAFNDFAGQLCGSFSRVCGAFADAYFESIGAAAGAGHGGGGQDTGRWDGKNDDDEKRKPFILGHIPTRKSGRGGHVGH